MKRAIGRIALAAAAAWLAGACSGVAAMEAAHKDLALAQVQCGRAMSLKPNRQEEIVFRPYLRMAEQAYEQGDYEGASQYSALAGQNAEEVCRAHAAGRVLVGPSQLTSRERALKNRDQIESLINQLRKENDPDLDLVTLFEEAECRVEAAKRAFDKGDFDLAVGHTDEALMLIERRHFFFSFVQREIPSRDVEQYALPGSSGGSGSGGGSHGSSSSGGGGGSMSAGRSSGGGGSVKAARGSCRRS